ncbi:acyl-CoA dehydrogenase family protein [Streptomyces sp. NBC_00988]|uniref:acyl-CoA dehydrogenase family protein n=1 Tax=Streptomyces sp. NBC_00988 TaxID=2903704 RepID=UPI00386AEEA8|nr:acyl-CoA dehydrogenase family protein [Streptomyces sp. NBC_00988]
MTSRLTDQQKQTWASFREFADEFIAPEARAADEQQVLSRDLIKKLGSAGWLSVLLPEEWGGRALDWVSYGLMAEEMGRTCQNVRNFVACADMVSHAIWKWGTQEQKDRWLKRISSGEAVAAFVLTEPKVGSDAKSVQTEARLDGSDIVLRGVKKWISFGEIADVFLVFAQYEGRHTAFLVERETPGLRVEALQGLLGLRGSSLGEISFDDCRIPASSMVGQPGSGLVFVASTALDIGRYSTAWGCVGLAQACLEEASAYARGREQYGTAIIGHQLVQRMLADMLTGATASRLMCLEAGLVKDAGGMDAVNRTLMAKYFASTTANRVAADAVQVLGAYGIGGDSSVARLFRDAKVMEIIEGTTQLHQAMLGTWSAHVPHPAGTSARPL